VEDQVVQRGEVVWSPSNLQDQQWWYWRVRVTRQVEVPDPAKREYGTWSSAGYFYTDFSGKGPPPQRPPPVAGGHAEAPQRLWPPDGEGVSTPNPNFRVQTSLAPGDTAEFYIEVDRLPSFDGEFLQRSSDRPLLFEMLWEDLKYTGNRRDDDGDGRVDEELVNGRDDDGDGKVDEDIRHPTDGSKWPFIALGLGFGLVAYFGLALLGMPIFLIWGYVQSVNGIPHNLLPQIIGALLARFYFWQKYGKQEWRRYAMVLSVGFGVGMSLVGMFCAALAMVSKAVSALAY
jgi:hypothetical protein